MKQTRRRPPKKVEFFEHDETADEEKYKAADQSEKAKTDEDRNDTRLLNKARPADGRVEEDVLQEQSKSCRARWAENIRKVQNRNDAQHKEQCKDYRRRQDKGEEVAKSSLYRKRGASGTPLSFEAKDLKEALLPIATCYKELHSTKWSTCVKCWRAWFAGKAQQGKAHREYQQESKILSKTALPVTKLAPIEEWTKPKRRMHVSCSCGVDDPPPKEADGTIVCGNCEKEDWSRQLVVCEDCILACSMNRCGWHHQGME